MHSTFGSRILFSRAFFISFAGLVLFACSGVASAATTGTLYPTADGTYTAWTPKSGSTHYTQVDETTCNGTTDYVSTATTGNRDSYTVSLSGIPSGSTITDIQLTPCASRNSSGGGSATMNVFYRFEGVNSADAGAYALTGTTPSALAATNFSSLSHVKGSGSSLEVGAIYTSGTKGARLSRLATVITYTPLAAPTNLAGTASTTAAAIALTWTDNATNETGYVVDRSSDGVNYTTLATTSANVSSYTDSGLSLGALYHYRVKAFNGGGSTYYATTSATTANVPAAPSALSATPGTFSVAVSVTWTDNSSNETGFKIERSTDGVNFSEINTTAANATSYDDSSVSPVTTYYYKVRATNALGNSAYSNTDDATTVGAPAVTTDSASGITTSAATLNGTANPNGVSATGWFRYSTTNPGTCNTTFGTRAPASGGSSLGSGTSGVGYAQGISGLAAGTTYYVCAIAQNSVGTTTGSVQSFTTTPAAPSAPTGLDATNVSGTQNDLTWTDASSNEDGFKVERSTNGGAYTQIATTSAGATSYSDTGVSADNTYSYRVRAYNAGGNSSYSNTDSVITATVVPNDPTSLTASGTVAFFTWSHSGNNEEGFKIERSTDGVNFSQIDTTGANITYYFDGGVSSGTYYYQVRAYNAVGNSGYSNIVNVTL